MSALLCRRAANTPWGVPARCAGVSWLEPASWRLRHTPVTECTRLKEFQVGLKWTDGRVACWRGLLQQVKQTPWDKQGTELLYRGGHERSAASFRSLLSPNARGLCSGKSEETPDKKPDLGEGAVPGHGLFKFKELVSTHRDE